MAGKDLRNATAAVQADVSQIDVDALNPNLSAIAEVMTSRLLKLQK